MATDTSQKVIGLSSHDPDAALTNDDLRYKGFIENSVDGTWRLDFEEPIPLHLTIAEQVEMIYRHGYFAEANHALARQYGFDTPEDIIGFCLEEWLPRDLPTSTPILTRLAQSNYCVQGLESVERDRHGNRKYFINNCIGEIENGKLLRVWGTAKDITRQKQLEEETRLRSAVFEQIPDACVIVDAEEENVLYMNPAFTDITGYTADDIPAGKLSFLQGADTNPDTIAQIRAAITGHVSFKGEILNYRKDGTPFWNLMRISPIRDSEGDVTHYVGILSDITEVKCSQLELNEQRKQLAHIMRVATMGELTAALAHELNQPLTAILSNAQAAQRFLDQQATDVGEVREILRDIVADDKRAAEVMHHIRRLMKRDNILFERLDINHIIQEVHELVRHDLSMKQVSIRMRLTPGLPAVQGDSVQLQQVIMNLFMNASQALQGLDSGEASISVVTGCQDNRYIEIIVEDSGPGIREDALDKIFQPFFTTRESGLGMGLAIIKTIVAAHGGRVWVENKPEQGAVFHVMLPVASGEPAV